MGATRSVAKNTILLTVGLMSGRVLALLLVKKIRTKGFHRSSGLDVDDHAEHGVHEGDRRRAGLGRGGGDGGDGRRCR